MTSILNALGMSGFQIGSFLHPESLKMWSENYCALRDFLLNKLWKDCIGPQIVQSFGIQIVKKSACFRSEKVLVSIFPRKSESHSSGIPSVEASKQASKQASRQAWRNAVPSNPAVKCANWKSAREWISVSNPADSDKYQVNWKIKQKATFANIVDLVLLFSAIWGYTLKMIIEIGFEKCERMSHKDLRDQ